MRISKSIRSLVLVAAALMVGASSTAGQTTKPATAKRRVVVGDPPPVKLSPLGVAPLDEGERTNIAARGAGQGCAIYVFAPIDGGFTSVPSPTLYYYVTKSTTDAVDVVVAKRVEGVKTADRVVRVRLEDGVKAGLHALDLAALKKRLEPGVTYSFVVQPIDANANVAPGTGQAMALIRYSPPTDRPAPSDAEAFARLGYWYDAVSDLTDRAKDDPGAVRWREAFLLKEHVFGAKGQASDGEAALLAALRTATPTADN